MLSAQYHNVNCLEKESLVRALFEITYQSTERRIVELPKTAESRSKLGSTTWQAQGGPIDVRVMTLQHLLNSISFLARRGRRAVMLETELIRRYLNACAKKNKKPTPYAQKIIDLLQSSANTRVLDLSPHHDKNFMGRNIEGCFADTLEVCEEEMMPVRNLLVD